MQLSCSIYGQFTGAERAGEMGPRASEKLDAAVRRNLMGMGANGRGGVWVHVDRHLVAFYVPKNDEDLCYRSP